MRRVKITKQLPKIPIFPFQIMAQHFSTPAGPSSDVEAFGKLLKSSTRVLALCGAGSSLPFPSPNEPRTPQILTANPRNRTLGSLRSGYLPWCWRHVAKSSGHYACYTRGFQERSGLGVVVLQLSPAQGPPGSSECGPFCAGRVE